jgi:hypothetical protein
MKPEKNATPQKIAIRPTHRKLETKVYHNQHHWADSRDSKLMAHESYILNKSIAHNSNHIN